MQDNAQQFETLVRPHFEALHRAAFRLTRSRQDSEDLVQEVCLRAYSKLGQLETLDYVLGWLLRVQYRLFIDGARRRRRSPLDAMPENVETSHRFASDEPGPEEMADAARTGARLAKAWAGLKPEQRALLALHAEGYRLSELQQITGKSPNVLSARLHRARARLAKLMGKSELTRNQVNYLENPHEVS